MKRIVAGHSGACGRGQDHVVGGAAVRYRPSTQTRPRRPRRRLPRHGRHGTAARHHHLHRAGRHRHARPHHHPARHSWTRRLLRRNGTYARRARLRHPRHLRRGRHPRPYRNAVATAQSLSGAHIRLRHKMDSPGADKTQLLAQLKKRFSDGCVDFTEPIDGERMEEIAMQNETAMDAYLDTETVPDETIRAMIARRELFPCYFGSALKMDGIEQFVAGFERFAQEPQYNGEFGARIYKVSHDAQGNRLTWLKVTGGELKAKMMLSGTAHAGDADAVAEDGQWHEKADQVRVYSGAKSTTVDTVPSRHHLRRHGSDADIPRRRPRHGAGRRQSGPPAGAHVHAGTGECDIHKCLVALRELEDEDPLLHVVWQSRLEEVHLQLMGAVQLEIIQQIMHDRFGLDVTFGPGSIVYKETIARAVEGVGHFEPLRHYAEVHLLLSPAERGSGITVTSTCSEDVLDKNWQRLIATHVEEKEHRGCAHRLSAYRCEGHYSYRKSTCKAHEGGDFRQATYRAIRQGLKSTESVLLEPYYSFILQVPMEYVGRAMTDLEQRFARAESPAVLPQPLRGRWQQLQERHRLRQCRIM